MVALRAHVGVTVGKLSCAFDGCLGGRLPPGGDVRRSLIVHYSGRTGSASLRAAFVPGEMRDSRRTPRARAVRFFLFSMFAVPLVSLLALWIFAAAPTVSNAVADHYYNSGVRIIDTGFASLTAALPAEKHQAYL